MEDPVVQVIDQTGGEIVYTLRIKGHEFRPKVFRKGAYTVKVGRQDGAIKELRDIAALDPEQPGELAVEFKDRRKATVLLPKRQSHSR